MTADETKVLVALRRELVPLTISEIAAWEGIKPGPACRAMQRLEAKGLVFRNSNGYFELTPDTPDAA